MADARAAGPFSRWERSVARRYLFAKRKNGGVALIAIISFCAVMLAVFALITVMSVMNGFRAELLGRIVGFNGHLYAQSPLINGPDREAILRRIKAAPGVIQAAPMVEAQAMVIGPTQVTGAIVRGVTTADLRHMSLISGNIKKGSLDGFGQGEYGGDIVLIGDRMAQTLGVQPGDPITLISPSGPATAFGSSTREKNYIVGGLFSVGMSQFDEAFIYMPLEQAQLFFGRDTSVDYVEIKVDDPDKAKDYKHDVEVASGPGALVSDWQDKNHSYFTALQVERKVMRLILFCIVAIATLNIISSLVMLVKNKGKDIAILRTMGASQGAILRIFVMAGASIGVAGTLCGLALGVVFCAYITPIQNFVEWVTGTAVFSADVYMLSHIPAKIDWSEVTGIVAISALMSVLATLPPALRASRLDPVEALRYEYPILALRGVERVYKTEAGDLPVLRGVDIDVYPGEVVGLIGPSGSGKSSLLHSAGLLEHPDAGLVALEGRDCSRLSERARTRIRLGTVGFVYQFHHLLPEFSALENVAMPLLIAGARRKDAEARAKDLLGGLGLGHRLDHQPAQMSGGEQQRVAIARALANRPKLLLADEPTGNLDPATSSAVFQALYQTCREQGVAALIATHNMDLARYMDRVVALKDGHLEAQRF